MGEAKEELLLKESFKYINDNQDVLSNEIPQHLIDFWSVEDIQNFDLESTNTTNQGAVFMYALIQQKMTKGLTEFDIHPEKLMEMYQNWQLLLTAIAVSNLTDKKFEPFKVFDFDNFEEKELKFQ